MGAEVIRHQLLPQNVGISGNLANYQSDTQCQKAMEGRFRSVARLEKAIERLVLGDVAKVEKRQNKGAPPTTMIRMNPKLFVDEVRFVAIKPISIIFYLYKQTDAFIQP